MTTSLTLRGIRPGATHMLLVIIVLLALTAIVIGSRLRVPGGAKRGSLGWMSEQWLADYRASHLS